MREAFCAARRERRLRLYFSLLSSPQDAAHTRIFSKRACWLFAPQQSQRGKVARAIPPLVLNFQVRQC